MEYLDTNIIIYAIQNHPEFGKSCGRILEEVESGKLKVCSSMLVLVETINVLTKINKILKKDEKEELVIEDNINAILSLPITWFDLNFLVIKKATEYKYNISGVDYVHIATMELNSIKKVISLDRELDRVDFVKRVDPTKEEIEEN
jgi:predicted nucleic acid-binding protein|tara:strand:+ start:311 stop:748 length:438 start_codon:yes stop_codon:yes gene_type:complete